MADQTERWPTELRLRDGGRTLSLRFDDGAAFDLTAEYLRVTSPSAEVQGHGPGERRTIPGKKDVVIREVLPTGNYAVRLVFDDGHDTGIFTWSYLATLGTERDTRWRTYLDELADRGLGRER